MNIELSDIITQRYRMHGVQTLMIFVYIFFIIGDLFLGVVVLSGSLIILEAVGAAIILVILLLSPDYVLLKYRYGMLDWILDKVECKQGDEVRIIMTNLSDKQFPKEALAKEEVMWKLVEQCDDPNNLVENNEKILRSGKLCTGFQIGSSHNFIWVLETKKVEKDGDIKKSLNPGVYCLYRRVLKNDKFEPENKMKPLCRKLRIISKPEDAHGNQLSIKFNGAKD